MKEYFVDVQGANATHSFRVRANFTPGSPFVLFPRNEDEFLTPGDPPEVDIQDVYIYNQTKERKIEFVSDYLNDSLEREIIKQEQEGERDGF